MLGKPNSFAGLLRGKRKRSGGTLVGASKECWLLLRVCAAARDSAMESEDMETLYRFVGLEAQILKTYAGLIMPSELEERVKAIESRRTKIEDVPVKSDDSRWNYRDLIDED